MNELTFFTAPLLFERRMNHAKLYALETDLKNGTIFGHRQVFIQRVIEFQKRYIPHAHIVIRLDSPEPPHNPRCPYC